MPDKLVDLEIDRWVEEKKCNLVDCTECNPTDEEKGE